MSHELSRRAFLVGGAAALAAAACSRAPVSEGPAASPDPLQVVTTSIELVEGDDRLAFALFRGQRPIGGVDAGGELLITGPDGESSTVALRTFAVDRGLGGDDHEDHEHPDEGELVFVAHHVFADAGFYDVRAQIRIGDERHTLEHRIGVADRNPQLAVPVGEPGVGVATPTLDDARGVDPICTRTPPCALHAVSLDDALASGRPVVATFATPAFCASRICGPAVDVVEEVAARVPEAHYVHVEVYTDRTASQTTEGFKAWRLGGEPWVFMASADGIVRHRLSGPTAPWELEEYIRRLVS